MAVDDRPPFWKRLFWWTLGIFVVLFVALVLLARQSPDQPFSYVLH